MMQVDGGSTKDEGRKEKSVRSWHIERICARNATARVVRHTPLKTTDLPKGKGTSNVRDRSIRTHTSNLIEKCWANDESATRSDSTVMYFPLRIRKEEARENGEARSRAPRRMRPFSQRGARGNEGV